MNLYDIEVIDNKGNKIKLDKYKGKVLLIINTATRCGYTNQYIGLENLYLKYKDKGLVILDFPCNQFLNQAPETDQDIDRICNINFGTTFDRFKKIDVNGKNQSPLYIYLKQHQPKHFPKRINWNFTKFLIDKDGVVIDRFPSRITPKELEKEVIKYL